MAHNTHQDTFENFGLSSDVLRSVLEGEFVNVTYWTVKLLKQGLKPLQDFQKELQKNISDTRSDNPYTTVERSLGQFNRFVEQLDQQVQQAGQTKQSVAELEKRLVALETRVGQSGSVTEDSEAQYERRIAALEERIARIEQLLHRGSSIPTLIDRQGQTIIALENRVAELESSTRISS